MYNGGLYHLELNHQFFIGILARLDRLPECTHSFFV